jgi:hypothetical protein
MREEELLIQALRNRVRDNVYEKTDEVVRRLIILNLDENVNHYASKILQDYKNIANNPELIGPRLKSLLSLIDDYYEMKKAA